MTSFMDFMRHEYVCINPVRALHYADWLICLTGSNLDVSPKIGSRLWNVQWACSVGQGWFFFFFNHMWDESWSPMLNCTMLWQAAAGWSMLNNAKQDHINANVDSEIRSRPCFFVIYSITTAFKVVAFFSFPFSTPSWSLIFSPAILCGISQLLEWNWVKAKSHFHFGGPPSVPLLAVLSRGWQCCDNVAFITWHLLIYTGYVHGIYILFIAWHLLIVNQFCSPVSLVIDFLNCGTGHFCNITEFSSKGFCIF